MSKIKVTKVNIKLKNLDKVIENHSLKNARNIESKAPKRTGEYASSFGVKKAGENDYQVGIINENYRLGHILEFGTVHQKAQPHFRPAFKEDIKKFKKDLENIEVINDSK